MNQLALSVLLIALSSSTQGKANYSENNYMMEKVAADITGMFPPPTNIIDRSETIAWDDAKKRTVGMNVFELLSTWLDQPERNKFENVLAGATCLTGGEQHDMLQIKISKYARCEEGTLEPNCSSKILNFVYCSWIGKLQGNVPRVTLGAHCFRSRRGLGKHEAELTGADVCTEWKYGDTTLYRLPIPARKSLWDVKFILYQPPVTTSRRPNGSKTSTSKEEPPIGIPLNPEGRTGIAGLGMLKRYGKNKMEIPVIVRYHDNVKEVLLCNRQGTEQTFGPLPAFYKRTSTKGMQLAPEGLLMEEYFFGLVKAEYKTRCPSEKFRSAMKPTRRIFNDNLPHPYTTDNAWVKAAIYMVTTEQEPCFDHLDLSHGKNYFHYEWKAFNGTAVSNVRALTKILLSKEASKEIAAENHAYAVQSFFFLSVAAAIVVLLIGGLGAGLLIFSIPLALLFIASVLIYYHTKKWVFIHKRI